MVFPPHLSTALHLFNRCQDWGLLQGLGKEVSPRVLSHPSQPLQGPQIWDTPHFSERGGPVLLCFLWPHVDHGKQVGVTFFL